MKYIGTFFYVTYSLCEYNTDILIDAVVWYSVIITVDFSLQI